MTMATGRADEKQHHILRNLEALEQEQKVKILFAVESGSRAWGFPSADSDYDVRFIYSRLIGDYLSVQPIRDVIETPLVQDEVLGVPFDLNGWDIRKALQLALKSNAVVWEWLTSPIQYIGNPEQVRPLKEFVQVSADLSAYAYHYDRLARSSWNEMGQPDANTIKLKKYFYAIRPVLALTWLDAHKSLPPMNIQAMMADLDIPKEAGGAIVRLTQLKLTATENDTIEKDPQLDRFITARLENKVQRPEPILSLKMIEQADAMFRTYAAKTTNSN